ncbi:hypothetical protein LG296_15265 [Ureibacillus chungkukjangi]|uniref:hypothetical protein n=1 Tax=Ureibacillus chungkukjangi TaxID=1202712 RepID=UPI00384A794B
MEKMPTNKKIGGELLPHIKPTEYIKVWDFESINKYKDRPGIYIFWDKYSEEFENSTGEPRDNFDSRCLPLYIGRAYDLAGRIKKHLREHTHTKYFSTYFYSIAIYDMETCIQDNKKLKKIAKSNQLLDSYALTDLYEPYMIMRRIPFFNSQSNHFADEDLRKFYFQQGYYKTNRRWETQIEPSKFLKIKVPFESYISLNEFISTILKRDSRTNSLDKEKINEVEGFLTKYIEDQCKKNEFPIEGYKKNEEGTWIFPIDTVLYYVVSEGFFDFD